MMHARQLQQLALMQQAQQQQQQYAAAAAMSNDQMAAAGKTHDLLSFSCVIFVVLHPEC
jgi:hypothetical protein